MLRHLCGVWSTPWKKTTELLWRAVWNHAVYLNKIYKKTHVSASDRHKLESSLQHNHSHCVKCIISSVLN